VFACTDWGLNENDVETTNFERSLVKVLALFGFFIHWFREKKQ